jgi:hypothetical protein
MLQFFYNPAVLTATDICIFCLQTFKPALVEIIEPWLNFKHAELKHFNLSEIKSLGSILLADKIVFLVQPSGSAYLETIKRLFLEFPKLDLGKIQVIVLPDSVDEGKSVSISTTAVDQLEIAHATVIEKLKVSTAAVDQLELAHATVIDKLKKVVKGKNADVVDQIVCSCEAFFAM